MKKRYVSLKNQYTFIKRGGTSILTEDDILTSFLVHAYKTDSAETEILVLGERTIFRYKKRQMENLSKYFYSDTVSITNTTWTSSEKLALEKSIFQQVLGYFLTIFCTSSSTFVVFFPCCFGHL